MDKSTASRKDKVEMGEVTEGEEVEGESEGIWSEKEKGGGKNEGVGWRHK